MFEISDKVFLSVATKAILKAYKAKFPERQWEHSDEKKRVTAEFYAGSVLLALRRRSPAKRARR